MRKISQKITDLKMNYYIAGHSSIKESRDARKTLAREANLSELIDQKEQLLQTKEIVAGYELRKIRNYAQQIDAGQLVQTPSVIALKDTIRTKIMSGQPVLLSGPVGTGKTKIAQEIYQEILEAKHTSGQINDDEYAGLRSTRIYNGNEESTKRDLDSRPTQLSNKADSEQAFTYEEGDITTCLRHGLPLIIDEANRTPPNFLSALKKYFALRP
ncbi:AAA family ATPase [Patescibacteria group bacterium]|nr:AAA family ATPase [Patescibacteria group bacterium]